jgi:POT family proton-dependent oligopeptide transporter
LAVASIHEQSSGQKVSVAWALTFHLIKNIGFAMVAPVGLALFSRAAPPGTAGLMIGFYYVNFFIANMIVGRIGALLESMNAVSFWTLHASLVGLAAMVLLIYAVCFRGLLAPRGAQN